jgi:hypothetical protein
VALLGPKSKESDAAVEEAISTKEEDVEAASPAVKTEAEAEAVIGESDDPAQEEREMGNSKMKKDFK